MDKLQVTRIDNSLNKAFCKICKKLCKIMMMFWQEPRFIFWTVEWGFCVG